MYLKCIGGKLDGESVYVPDHLQVNDIAKHPKPIKLPSMYNVDGSELSIIDTQYYEYRIQEMYFSKNSRYKFLIPIDWTLEQAVLHQFKK